MAEMDAICAPDWIPTGADMGTFWEAPKASAPDACKMHLCSLSFIVLYSRHIASYIPLESCFTLISEISKLLPLFWFLLCLAEKPFHSYFGIWGSFGTPKWWGHK
jgi:hypothetical protein